MAAYYHRTAEARSWRNGRAAWARRKPSSMSMAIPARAAGATAAVETTGNQKTHTIHTMPTAWCPWDEKTLYSARKGGNVFPATHERQNDYRRYHAYQLATESVR